MSLAPEHLADLRASGLSDETIDALQVEAVRPADLNIKGATSAYTLPYFNFDGSVNCFARRKLFPPVKTSHGTMKYWQPKDSLPHLYLPPIADWQAAAKDVTTALTITEGEKKAAAACQQGLITAGIGGNWCHTSTLDSGDTLTLPMLDEFQWANRPVLICPDSDGWGKEQKAWNILAGFFVLAKDVQGRGADVRFIVLPDLHGGKAGLDDWLLVPGNDVAQGWPKLERLPLDDVRFNDLTAWWQRWREKQATHSAIKQHDLNDLTVTDTAGVYAVRSEKHGVRFAFDRLTTTGGRVTAELTVTLGPTEILPGVDVSLTSDSSQTNLTRSLKTIAPTIPWKLLLQKACSLVLKRHREGEPVIILEPTALVHVPFLVNPLIYNNHPSLIFAPGGSLKSYLALWVALLACHGARQNGLAALACPVLYLDWELNCETVGGRLKALRTGHPELAEYVPYYRRCEYPLHQEVHQIARYVAEHGVQLLILDSAAMACGGELNSPDTVVKLTRALRTIGCSSLLLAHISKLTPEGQERTAFGSVYFRELSRNVWEMERAEGDGPARVILTHKKNNFGAYQPALAFEFQFNGDATRISSCNPADEPAFEAKLPLAARIRNLLDDGALRTAEKIADALGAKLSSVTVTLSKHKGVKWQMLGGQGQETTWTVLAPRK